MKNFLITKFWPVLAGFVVASIVMMLLEYINSFLFPLPADLDWNDYEAVKAFTSSLPWTAYILVLIGWALGSFKGGYVASYLSGDGEYRTAFALGIILTIAGIANVVMIGHPLAFTITGLPLFLVFTYLGHRYLRYVHSKRVPIQIA